MQEQKCLLIKGQFISIYKDLVDKRSVKVTHVVNEGDMIVTQPNVAHTMIFLEDSVLLNLVTGEREHKNYGMTHTKKYDLVNENFGHSLIENYNEQSDLGQNMQSNNQSSQDLDVKKSSENLTTISDVIRKAGGITSTTDLSKIEIIRDVPLGKGGGKKRAFIDFNSYLNESDPTNDIRIFDGDSLFFPKLSKAKPNQIPKSVLSGISPKFISVNLFGRVENPGVVKLPLEATLSDAIDITGPIKPLSGKIVLIRYEKDGTLIKKNISYSASAKRGSKRNPYLKEDDLISVRNSIFGKTTGVLKEVTAPFVGIYSTKELIEGFSD